MAGQKDDDDDDERCYVRATYAREDLAAEEYTYIHGLGAPGPTELWTNYHFISDSISRAGVEVVYRRDRLDRGIACEIRSAPREGRSVRPIDDVAVVVTRVAFLRNFRSPGSNSEVSDSSISHFGFEIDSIPPSSPPQRRYRGVYVVSFFFVLFFCLRLNRSIGPMNGEVIVAQKFAVAEVSRRDDY